MLGSRNGILLGSLSTAIGSYLIYPFHLTRINPILMAVGHLLVGVGVSMVNIFSIFEILKLGESIYRIEEAVIRNKILSKSSKDDINL